MAGLEGPKSEDERAARGEVLAETIFPSPLTRGSVGAL